MSDFTTLREASRTMIGYPLDQSPFPWPLSNELLTFRLNNLGDPFRPNGYGVNTFEQERELIGRLGDLFGLPEPWGYVTSCGSEGNMAGIRAGLERYPDAFVVASDKVHCSVDKACRFARAPLVKAKTRGDHGIDVTSVFACLAQQPGRPVVVVLTAGTVMAGAVDDIAAVCGMLRMRRDCYIHVDAALAGFVLPYLAGSPPFDFRLPIDSLSVSGHKQLGVPIPCGVFLSRHQPKESGEYGTSQMATIGGSRSGLAVLLMLHAFQCHGPEGMTRRALAGIQTAEYASRKLRAMDWPAERVSDYTTTVLLKRPRVDVVSKWQLAWDGDTAHVVCMPHVTTKLIDEFAHDLKGVQE